MISRGYTGLLSGPERPWLDRSWELLDTAVQPYIRLYTGIQLGALYSWYSQYGYTAIHGYTAIQPIRLYSGIGLYSQYGLRAHGDC